MSQERTELPTQKRLRQLAAQGTNAHSADLTSALVLLGAVVGIQQAAPYAISQAVFGIRTVLIQSSHADLNASNVSSSWQPMLPSASAFLLGVMGPVSIIALAVGLFQIKGRLSFAGITPHPGRL